MKKLLSLAVFVGVSAFALAQTNPLTTFMKKMSSAEGLKTSYTVTGLDGVAANYTITLGRPGSARIDGPQKLIVADGTNITVLVKSLKKYYTKPQTKAELAKQFADPAVMLWSGFFDAGMASKLTTSRLPDANRNGVKLQAVKVVVDSSKGSTITAFFDPKSGDLKQAVLEKGAGKSAQVLDITTLALGPSDPATFAFKAPVGTEEVKEADLITQKWIESLDEALALASQTNRPILVDFYATWCGPCKMLEANVFTTEKFKNFSANMVLCRIDVDLQPQIAQKFMIEAMPTTILLSSSGAELGRFVGYVEVDEYLSNLKGFIGN
ncbi:MAG: thioredoxin family protein [Chthonomonas sp.]|nr:thioredoxin family protein [Chthonomonas sp.]